MRSDEMGGDGRRWGARWDARWDARWVVGSGRACCTCVQQSVSHAHTHASHYPYTTHTQTSHHSHANGRTQGGSVYEVRGAEGLASGQPVELTFGREAASLDLSRVGIGDLVWRNKDAFLERALRNAANRPIGATVADATRDAERIAAGDLTGAGVGEGAARRFRCGAAAVLDAQCPPPRELIDEPCSHSRRGWTRSRQRQWRRSSPVPPELPVGWSGCQHRRTGWRRPTTPHPAPGRRGQGR